MHTILSFPFGEFLQNVFIKLKTSSYEEWRKIYIFNFDFVVGELDKKEKKRVW